MHIKQVLISGFRSFRSQNEIDAFSPKHNVIIGRNGSGKSNFFDAIQFVLLAPKFANLRQEDRQNLLHEGAGSSVMAAYVEIIFDNSDGRFSVDSDEVVLRRTVGQKKDEYFLNRKRIQKNEVVSLLESAGFSKSNPYYIVQQGKVANLCIMKDKDRLQLLKEIAGTTIYEERRLESIKIIEETSDKQEKVEEVLAFIEERLDELDREKKELTEFETFDKQRRALEYTLYDHEITVATQQLTEVEGEREIQRESQQKSYMDLRDIQDEIIAEEEEFTQLQGLIERLQQKKDHQQDEVKQLTTKKAALELECQEMENHKTVQSRNQQEWTEQLNEVIESIAQYEHDLKESIQPVVDQKEEEVQKAELRLQTIRRRIEQLYTKQGHGTRYNSKQERDAFLSQQIDTLQGQVMKKQSLYQQQIQELESIERQLQVNQQDLQSDENAHKLRANTIDQLNQSNHDLINQRNALQERRKLLWKEIETVEESLVSATNEFDKAKSQLQRNLPKAITTGIATIERYVQEHNVTGYHGPLIDNIHLIHPNFRNAVEVAGGNSLFHIIVDTDIIAATLIQVLESCNGGRLTFLPLNRVKVPRCQYPQSNDVRPLIDVALRFDDHVAPAIRMVFGPKLIAKNLDVAAHYSKESKMDAITMDGDVVTHTGVFEGGYHDDRQSRIDAVLKIRESGDKVQECKQRKEEMNNSLTAIDSEMTEILRQLSKLQSERDQLHSKQEQSSKELHSRSKQLHSMNQVIQEGHKQLIGIQREIDSIHEQLTVYRIEMNEPLTQTLSDEERDELMRLNEESVVLTRQYDQLQTEKALLTSERDQIVAQLENSLNKRKEELEMKLQSSSSSMSLNVLRTNSLGISGSTTAGGLGGSSSSQSGGLGGDTGTPVVHDINAYLIDLQLELEHIETTLIKTHEELSSTERLLKSKQSEYVNIERAIEDKHDIEKGILDTIATLTQSLDKLVSKRTTLINTISTRQKMIRDLGSLPRKEVEEFTGFGKNTTKLMAKLKQINDKLKDYSSVNRKALDQYLSFHEQREFLLERKKELDNDTKAIEKLMSNLDGQKDEAILRTFRTVNQHFMNVFQELVPGGKARLIMRTSRDGDDEGEDIDEIVDNTILEEEEREGTDNEVEEEEGDGEGEEEEEEIDENEVEEAFTKSKANKRVSKGRSSNTSSRGTKRKISSSSTTNAVTSKSGSKGKGKSKSPSKQTTTNISRGSNKVNINTFTGVQISVQFSGTGQQYQMQQLSGGQKAIVALALIFAIQRSDPAPFYLFDEIDQALDASYRDAVAKLIQKQANSDSSSAQFITTTFRPELVDVADKCFGIALMNKVSNIYPCEKADAQNFVMNLLNEEEAVGTVAAVPPARGGRPQQTPVPTNREDMDPHGYRRKGRARALEKAVEEEDEEEGDEGEEGEGIEIDAEDELALRKLGLDDIEDEDEGEMST